MAINPGYSSLSHGPEVTQAIPFAQQVKAVPTHNGLPHGAADSAFSSTDGRYSDIPEFTPAVDWDEKPFKGYQHPAGPDTKQKFEKKQANARWENKRFEQAIGERDKMRSHITESGTGPDHINSGLEGHFHSQAEKFAKTPEQKARLRGENSPAHDDGDEMSSMSEDANPVTPFHDVIRNHGGKYAGHTREGKHGEIRKNNYVIPNPKGGEEKVELHAHQGGPDYGNVNSITHSGDPEATAPRVNNSPEKLDRNIHAQSYRGAPDRPAKMKPAEVRANHKMLTE
jgi:hypothetical protein